MIQCDKGTDFLIMRLIVVLIASGMLLVMAATYLSGCITDISRGNARAEISNVVGSAKLEYTAGCAGPGSGIDIMVTVPECVDRIVLGSSPGPLEPGEDLDREPQSYFIKFKDGQIETFFSDVPLAYGDIDTGEAYDRPVDLYPGKYLLNIRTMSVNGDPMAAIFGGRI
ncbi:hypothetical protein CUJ83_14860 [Methanocella sp. CWC-04]|uniref:Uncharacterized protein n=1 Tax=Methanooceanicella nereidis TaxID=2052831 RepID=A0AAP2REV2_9EURY|nr:hypothetical protein [Methanocella sp. CWC-04]MCD1296281.1 hypothetical protein [Methanocella sp. CWC-04]